MAELTKHDAIDDYPYLSYAPKANIGIPRIFAVTGDDNGLYADFTFNDIIRAFESGITPVVHVVYETPILCSIVSAYYDNDNSGYVVVFMFNGEQCGVIASNPDELMSYSNDLG